MKHNLIYFPLLSILTANVFGVENWERINQIIWKEKQILLSLGNSCIDTKRDPQDSLFVRYAEERDTINEIQKLMDVITALRKYACCQTKHRRIILNEKVFLILLDILTEMQDKKLSHGIHSFLYEKRNYEFFERNSPQVKKAIMKGPFGGTQSALLLLCNINEKEKELLKKEYRSFFKDELPFYIRIRLGEKDVEDSLIQQYSQETDFEKLKKLVEELELAGTEKCEMVLVKSLGTKKVEQHTDRYSFSILFYIIQAMGRLNPENAVPNDEFIDLQKELEHNSNNHDMNVQLTRKYLEKLYSFIDQRYGMKIEELKKLNFIYSFRVTDTPGDLDKVYKQLMGK